MRKLSRLALALLFILTLTACGPQITSIAIEHQKITLDRGETVIVEVTKSYTKEVTADQAARAIEKAEFTWTSSDESIALVDNGKITAVGPGEATISVSAKCGGEIKTASIQIVVVVPTEEIAGLPESLVLVLDTDESNAQLSPSVLPADTTDSSIAYTSKNSAVATVDSTGLVRAVGSGETEIVVRCGGIEAIIPVATRSAPTSNASRSTKTSSENPSGGDSPSPAPTPPGPETTPAAPPSTSGGGYFVESGGVNPDDGGF